MFMTELWQNESNLFRRHLSSSSIVSCKICKLSQYFNSSFTRCSCHEKWGCVWMLSRTLSWHHLHHQNPEKDAVLFLQPDCALSLDCLYGCSWLHSPSRLRRKTQPWYFLKENTITELPTEVITQLILLMTFLSRCQFTACHRVVQYDCGRHAASHQ